MCFQCFLVIPARYSRARHQISSGADTNRISNLAAIVLILCASANYCFSIEQPCTELMETLFTFAVAVFLLFLNRRGGERGRDNGGASG